MKNPTWRKVWREPAEAIAPTLTPEQAYNWKLQLEPPPLPSYPLHQQCVREMLHGQLKILTRKERWILCWRYGIGCREMTGEEVGAVFGVTRERIYQIERKALRRIRIRLLDNLDDVGVMEQTIAPKPLKAKTAPVRKQPAPIVLTAAQEAVLEELRHRKILAERARARPHWMCRACQTIPCMCD
jgi:hypothetical protein